MPALRERTLLAESRQLEIELRAGRGAPRYRLRYGRPGDWLLEYDNDAGHRRRLRGRAEPYAFRSVEQLRYDFERDLEALADAEDAAHA